MLIDTSNSFTCTTVNAVQGCLPTPVSNATLRTVGNKCFVFGGTDAEGACYNDIRSLDIGMYLDSNDITVGEGSSSDYCFKILIIGDSGELFIELINTANECTLLFIQLVLFDLLSGDALVVHL